MTFYTMSCGYGKKREGRRISHLVKDAIPGMTRTTACGIKVPRFTLLWSFTDGQFIKSIDLMGGSTVTSRLEAVSHHITCKSCLRMYQGE